MTEHPSIGWCEYCGKHAFRSRSAARKACRRRHPSEKLQAYECPVIPGAWHGGHRAVEVIRGEVSRAQFYGPRGVGRVRQLQGTKEPLRRAR